VKIQRLNYLQFLGISVLTLFVIGLAFAWTSGFPPVSVPQIDGAYCGQSVRHYAPVGDDLIFNPSSSYDPDGWIMEYEWDFGDGNTYTSGDPYATLHSYSSSGNYSPSLTVTDNEDCTSTQHGYVTIFEVVITSVTPLNSGVSFTTRNGENRIECVADLKPDSLDGTYNSQIQWDIEDDPGLSGDSGDPADPQTGDDVTLTVTAPAAGRGRNYKLNYRIRASVTIAGKTDYSNWVTIE
jgi:hypothetical protein